MSDCPGADGLSCIDGWLYSSLNMMIFPTNKRCPTCAAVSPDDACVRDANKLCECWVRLANGVNCPLAPPSHRVINATPVMSFQCPQCDMVMMRGDGNTYHCITKDCDASGVKYKPVPWEMERVDG
jgi:hypothetical protein